jgi:hypothetical protein
LKWSAHSLAQRFVFLRPRNKASAWETLPDLSYQRTFQYDFRRVSPSLYKLTIMDRTDTSECSTEIPTAPNSPKNNCDDNEELSKIAIEDVGIIGELLPLSREAKDAFRRLECQRDNPAFEHHRQFVRVNSLGEVHITFSLSELPATSALGWIIGRGRKDCKNLGVDIPLLVDDNGEIAGRHARFTWMEGGGGFFIAADNPRGKTVTLNGEQLCREQRLIPYRNMISMGDCFFTIKFPTRTTEQETQFQIELAGFYRIVLRDSAPLLAPTPSEHQAMIGEWVVRNAISKGAFGHVYAVTHVRTGRAAAAKEIWRTPQNSAWVDEEVAMAELLIEIKHVCTSWYSWSELT